MRNKIILINPGKHWFGAASVIKPPTSLLPIGGMLDKHGYKVEIFDARLEDYHNLDLENVLAVGITCMSGRPIKNALEICKYIREKDKSIVIIWGGAHASMLPEQTVSNPYVDVVVRGEGEVTVLELMGALKSGKPLGTINGITYKNNGKIVSNPDRPFMNLDDAVDLAYHLLKREYLEKYKPEECFYYPDSRGCPYRCTYCYNTYFCRSTWRSKSIEKIREELKWIYKKYKPKYLLFMVDNFFVNKKRVEQIANIIVEEGFKFDWGADVRANYFDNFDADFLNLLRKSGCKGLNIGAESGSQRVLDFVQKDIKLEQTLKAAKMLKDAQINLTLFFMIGFPTQTREEVMETLDFIDKIEKINPNAKSLIAVFTPYPGTKLFDLVIKDFGFKPPQSLEEWGDWMFSTGESTTWFDPKYNKFLRRVTQTSLLRAVNLFVPSDISTMAKQIARIPFATCAKFRWSHRYFGASIDLGLWTLIQKQRGYA